jgi:hypothetical protein
MAVRKGFSTSSARRSTRSAVDAWERQRYFYDFALASFHGEGDVHAAWAEARDATTKMGQCASDWYYAVLRKGAPPRGAREYLE